ncbi:beta-N-acetyl-D-glucosaminide beta-1,4-N-acetylglucosaminyl-transferase-like [Anopheles albimanus]|uniref:beta-N-acetyl-D-glucosaminide beta-1,4-N-acetylglucosaminyl-transferase-like n=1 Tax=Anopheles albimanus TaxID=7167 RepID=UPI00164190D2|nr:beta-N-acetyl-D-glucosaminide beta-1,4-N-acetylglucosaminyl-transferase-like [Anopheles albimanus]XP_035793359.1 beta-N-acetyl-D-glucosaminide beta-1,4-N-acetylglucosaminyl-transferase-like [Anopheles albimanus]XP_035793360.1 beta-N-acetyl-D-glucosaminide beta-1,4-N-acetylglucosaminyl-transferase-like [Anopheles albimanus]
MIAAMAFSNRTLVIKGALIFSFLLILLNLLNSKLDLTSSRSATGRVGSPFWPKRTHTSVERFAPAVTHHDAGNVNASTHRESDQTLETNSGSSQNGSKPSEQRNQSLVVENSTTVKAHNNSSEAQNSTSLFQAEQSNGMPYAPVAESKSPVTDISEIRGTNDTIMIETVASSSKAHNNSSNVYSNSHINGSASTHAITSKGSSSVMNRNENGTVSKTFDDLPVTTYVISKRPIGSNSVPDVGSYKEEEHALQGSVDKFTIDICPPIPPNLEGPISVDTTYEPLNVIENRYRNKLQPGGQYTPPDCTARNRVAIIVPYRDREHHLPIFLKNLHQFLMKQQLEYGIYIVEQTAGSSFNRAALMNIGFTEAMKQRNWECMVFHDIDLLPMDDRNLYTCPDQPRHMSVAVDTFGFKLPYNTIFGGVSAMTEKQFRTVNGFSNSFWGWGGEDDDMSNRLKHFGFHIARYPVNIARYTMLNHKKEKANPKRFEKLVNGPKRYDSDGLNSLHYQLINLIKKPLYTWIHTEITPDGS